MLEQVAELWRYRELVRNLIARDLKVRYKNSMLGMVWSWVNPLLMMMVFTVVFTVINRAPPDIPHYPVFVLSGILPWNFFSASVVGATASIVGSGYLIKKVYLPREVLPRGSPAIPGARAFPAAIRGAGPASGACSVRAVA
jgi:lipopolysaccharide transport system permease protein